MSMEVLVPEPISKNIFEQYIRLIEKIRLDFKERQIEPDIVSGWMEELAFLDDIINGIERSLQDLQTNSRIQLKDDVSKIIIDSLSSWILILASWDRNPLIFQGFAYNFLAELHLISNYNNDTHEDFVRYMGKLSSNIESSNFLKNIDTSIFWYEQIQNTIPQFTSFVELQKAQQLLKRISSESPEMDYRRIDPLEISESMKDSVIELANPMVERFEKDLFKFRIFIPSLSSISNIEVLRKEAENLKIQTSLEELYLFDEVKKNAIWEATIKIYNETNVYNAAETGFLLWSISKALESIDDVVVELDGWGEGSKWFRFRIKLKSNAARVDLKDVLKKSRQAIETAYTKKPTDELRKFEAEKEKLSAEANKIQKETSNMMDSESATLLTELNIQNQILELQKKEVEIEEKKADVRLKNLQAINQLSELIKNGVIQNNSNIQIMINNILYLKKDAGKIAYDNIEFIDVKEKIEDISKESTTE